MIFHFKTCIMINENQKVLKGKQDPLNPYGLNITNTSSEFQTVRLFDKDYSNEHVTIKSDIRLTTYEDILKDISFRGFVNIHVLYFSYNELLTLIGKVQFYLITKENKEENREAQTEFWRFTVDPYQQQSTVALIEVDMGLTRDKYLEFQTPPNSVVHISFYKK